MTRYIYQIPCSLLSEEMCNPFYFSELNEREKLPNEVLDLLKICKEINERYTVDNFSLCFNLQDKGTMSGENYMFYPDEKFFEQIENAIN